MLESIARIEAQAYRLLAEQGATPATCVLTAGAARWGGAQQPRARLGPGLAGQTAATVCCTPDRAGCGGAAAQRACSWLGPCPCSAPRHTPTLVPLSALAPSSAGGGAKNPVWTELRRRELGVPVLESAQAEAAYGSALLAKRGAAIAAPSPTALVM